MRRPAADLSRAVRTLQTPLRPAGVPASLIRPVLLLLRKGDRGPQAFRAIVEKYPHTGPATLLVIFLSHFRAIGDNATAERELRRVASTHNDDLSALAKFALASVYRNLIATKRPSICIRN